MSNDTSGNTGASSWDTPAAAGTSSWDNDTARVTSDWADASTEAAGGGGWGDAGAAAW